MRDVVNTVPNPTPVILPQCLPSASLYNPAYEGYSAYHKSRRVPKCLLGKRLVELDLRGRLVLRRSRRLTFKWLSCVPAWVQSISYIVAITLGLRVPLRPVTHRPHTGNIAYWTTRQAVGTVQAGIQELPELTLLRETFQV